jgi:hypothetical protein
MTFLNHRALLATDLFISNIRVYLVFNASECDGGGRGGVEFGGEESLQRLGEVEVLALRGEVVSSLEEAKGKLKDEIMRKVELLLAGGVAHSKDVRIGDDG